MRDNSSYLKQDDAEEDHGDKGKDKKDKFSILEYVIGTTGFQGPEKIRESPYKLLKVCVTCVISHKMPCMTCVISLQTAQGLCDVCNLPQNALYDMCNLLTNCSRSV